MESKGDLWTDMHASASIRRGLSAASVLENPGSGDFSSHDGFLPSCSSSSSEHNSSTDLIDGAAKAIAILEDGEVHAMLKDAEIRAVMRKVTINEGVLNKAIQSLGGGEKGLKSLMGYILVWVKQQRDIKSSSQEPPPPSPPPSNPAWNFSTAQNVVPQPSSDAFQILSGILQPPPTTQLLGQEMRPDMTRPDMTRPDMMAPCSSQQHIAVPSVEPTPAMTTKAARRHRMTRQRQSFRARAASPVATAPVSVGAGSLWNTNSAAPPPVTSSGISGAQTTLRSAQQGRSMERLTVLLQKELRPSDVSHLGRIILPKKEAEEHMPSLATRGVSIQMEDFDSGHAWNLRYSVIPPPEMGSSPRVTSGTSSFWPNNKSRMYILENTAAFVMSHDLVEGDLLVIYRILHGGYVLRGMKKKNGRLDIEPVQEEFAYSLAKGSLEGPPSLHENGILVQWLYGGIPSKRSVKEKPVNQDEDLFSDELIPSTGPSFESDSSRIQTLEQFPSLTLDFFEEMMAMTRTEPDGT